MISAKTHSFYGLEAIFWLIPRYDEQGRSKGFAKGRYFLNHSLVLFGRNGAGKTSLLRLIPFAFGVERPDNLVPRNRSFADFYFGQKDRLSGYLVFCFSGPRGYTTVVAYRDQGVYNFLLVQNKTDDDLLFEGRRVIAPNELINRLNNLYGPDKWKKVPTLEAYRQLFDNPNTSPIAGLAIPRFGELLIPLVTGERFGFERVQNFLLHSEADLFGSILREEEKYFSDLSMVNEAARYYDWVRQSQKEQGTLEQYEKALQGMHKHLVIFNLAERASELLQQAKDEQQALETKMDSGRSDLETSRRRFLEEEKAAKSRLDAKRNARGEKKGILKAREGDLQKALRGCEELGLGETDLERLPDLKATLAKRESEERALQAELDRLEAQYQQALLELSRPEAQVNQDYRRAIERLRSEHDRDMDDLKARHVQEKASLEARRRDLHKEQGALELAREPEKVDYHHLVEAISLDQKELHRLELQTQKIHQVYADRRLELEREYAEQRQSLQHRQQETQARHKELHREIEDLQQGQEDLSQRVSEERRRLESLRQGDSLLAYLEKNLPQWRSTVGRVVAPELLERTDLTPYLGAGSNLYGVSLDLTRLPMIDPVSRSEAALKKYGDQLAAREAEIARQKAALEESQRVLGELEERLQVALKERQDALVQLEQSQIEELERLSRRQKEIAERLQGYQTRREQALQEFAAHKSRRLSEIGQELQTIRQRLSELEQQQQALEDAYRLKQQQLSNGLQQRLAELEQQREDLKKSRQVEEEQIRARYAQAEERIPLERLRRSIELLVRLAEKQGEFFEAQQELLPQIEVLDREIESLEQAISELRLRFEQERQALEDHLKAHEQTLGVIKAGIKELESSIPDPQRLERLWERAARLDRKISRAAVHFPKGALREILPWFNRRLKSDLTTFEEHLLAAEQKASSLVRILEDFEKDLMEDLSPARIQAAFEKIKALFYEKLHHLHGGLKSLAGHCDLLQEKLSSKAQGINAFLRSAQFPNVSWEDLRLRFKDEALEGIAQLRTATRYIERLPQEDSVLFAHLSDIDKALKIVEKAVRENLKHKPSQQLRSALQLEGHISRREGSTWKKERILSGSDLHDAFSTGNGVLVRVWLTAALVNLVRGERKNLGLPIPVDELGTLDAGGARELVQALEQRGLVLVGTMPSVYALPKDLKVVIRMIQVDNFFSKEEGIPTTTEVA